MRRQSNGSFPLMRSIILIGALLTLPSCATAASVSRPSSRLQSRNDPEHVILADCRDDLTGAMSSQMAYFPGTPDTSPQDVAVVSTTQNQARIWAGGSTKALFTGTGVTFTAKLGPVVKEGEYAGIGNNGYGDFSCWQMYFLNLYQYDGLSCSQVYDCDHRPAPTSTPTASPSASPSPTATNSSATQNKGSSESGLSTGALIGIICAVVGALTIAGIAAWVIWRRHLALTRAKPSATSGRGSSEGLFGAAGKSPSIQSPDSHFDPAMKEQQSVYEMEAQWHSPANTYSDMHSPLQPPPPPTPTQQEAAAPRVELDSKDRQYMQYMGRRR